MTVVVSFGFLSQAKKCSLLGVMFLGWVFFSSGALKASEEAVGASLDAQRWAVAPAFLAPVGGVLLAPRLAAPSRVVLSWLQKVRGVWLAAGAGLGYGLWKVRPFAAGVRSLADLSASDVWLTREVAGSSRGMMWDYEGVIHEDYGRQKRPPPGPGKGEKLFPFLPQKGEDDRADPRLEEQSLSPELASRVRNHLGSLQKLLTAEGKALPGFTHTMMLALKDLGNQQAQNLLKDKVGALVQKRVESTWVWEQKPLTFAEIFKMVEAEGAAMKSVFGGLENSHLSTEPTSTIGEYLSELMGSLEQVSRMLPLVKSWLSLTLSGVARPEEIEGYFEKLAYETLLNPFFRGVSPVSYEQLAGRLYTVAEALKVLSKIVETRHPDQAASLQFALAHLEHHLHTAARGLFRFEDVFQKYMLENPHTRTTRYINVSGYGMGVLGFKDLHKLTGVAVEQLSLVSRSLAVPQWTIPQSIPSSYGDPRSRLSLALSLIAHQLSPYILSDENNAILLQEESNLIFDDHMDGAHVPYRELGYPFWIISETLDSLAAYAHAAIDPFSEESIEEAQKIWKSFSPVVRRELAQSGSTKWWDEETKSYKEFSASEVEVQKVATALFGMILSLEKQQAFDEYLHMSLYQREHRDVMFNSYAAPWESLKFAAQGELSFEDEFMQEWQWYLFETLPADLKNDHFLEIYSWEEKYKESEYALYHVLPNYLKNVAYSLAGEGEVGWLGWESVSDLSVAPHKDRAFNSLEPHQKQSFIQIAKLYPYLRKLGRLAHALDGKVVDEELAEAE